MRAVTKKPLLSRIRELVAGIEDEGLEVERIVLDPAEWSQLRKTLLTCPAYPLGCELKYHATTNRFFWNKTPIVCDS